VSNLAAKRLTEQPRVLTLGNSQRKIRPESGGRRTSLGCSGLIPPPHPTSGATREALRTRPRRRPRPRFLEGGVLEYWSIGVLRPLRIAPAQRAGDALRSRRPRFRAAADEVSSNRMAVVSGEVANHHRDDFAIAVVVPPPARVWYCTERARQTA
jgi:hypothetical protein